MNDDLICLLDLIKRCNSDIYKVTLDYKCCSLLLDYINELNNEIKYIRASRDFQYNMSAIKDEIINISIKYIDEYCIDDEFICNLSSKEKGILEVRKILSGEAVALVGEQNE